MEWKHFAEDTWLFHVPSALATPEWRAELDALERVARATCPVPTTAIVRYNTGGPSRQNNTGQNTELTMGMNLFAMAVRVPKPT